MSTVAALKKICDRGRVAEGMSYEVREHPRAKYVRLRLTRQGLLVVVVPRGYPHGRVPALITEKRDWLQRACKRMAQARDAIPPGALAEVPSCVELRALGASYPVRVGKQVSETPARLTRTGVLELNPDAVDAEETGPDLRAWLRSVAMRELPKWLDRVARKYDFRYSSVTIRSQKTRWGSCSSKKRISLNDKLLFLPPKLVEYLLVHELSHTVELNHSPRFWRLVGSKLKDYEQRDQELGMAWRYVPLWAGEI